VTEEKYPYPPVRPRRLASDPLPPDPIICQLCGQVLWKITTSHLRRHDPSLTMDDYRLMFPGAPTCCDSLRGIYQDIALDHGQLRPRAATPCKHGKKRKRCKKCRAERNKRQYPKTAKRQGRRTRKQVAKTMRKGKWRKCPICGERFYVQRARLERGLGIACCHSHAMLVRHAAGESAKTQRGEWRTCSVCGTEYYVRRREVEQGRGQACSRSCSMKLRWASSWRAPGRPRKTAD